MIREPQHMRDRAAAFDADGTPSPWYYEMHEPGFNYRLPDMLCALGLSQLDEARPVRRAAARARPPLR